MEALGGDRHVNADEALRRDKAEHGVWVLSIRAGLAPDKLRPRAHRGLGKVRVPLLVSAGGRRGPWPTGWWKAHLLAQRSDTKYLTPIYESF